MRKNIIISTIMIIVILITTVSYAVVEVSVETLEESLRELFSKNIKISGEYEGGTSNMTKEPMQVKVENSKIIATEEGSEKVATINYEIQDNICKFYYTYTINVGEDSSTDEAFEEVMMIMLQQSMIDVCYLAAADAVGEDLSLAYTYYQQKSVANDEENVGDEEGNTSIIDEVFKMETTVSETEYTTNLEIDLLKMAELDENDLDSSSNYTVTIEEISKDEEDDSKQEGGADEEEDNKQDNGVKEEENKGQDNGVEEKDDKQDDSSNNKKYDTESNKELPKAGSLNISYGLYIIAVITLTLYLKSRKYKDIN